MVNLDTYVRGHVTFVCYGAPLAACSSATLHRHRGNGTAHRNTTRRHIILYGGVFKALSSWPLPSYHAAFWTRTSPIRNDALRHVPCPRTFHSSSSAVKAYANQGCSQPSCVFSLSIPTQSIPLTFFTLNIHPYLLHPVTYSFISSHTFFALHINSRTVFSA